MKIPKVFLLIPAVVITSIIIWGISLYKSNLETATDNLHNDLSSIAELKTQQIMNWLHERKADVAIIMNNKFLISSIQKWIINRNPRDYAYISEHFSQIQKHYDYHDILIVDSDKQVIFSLRKQVGPVEKIVMDSLYSAALKNKPVITGMHKDKDGQTVHLDIIIPLINSADIKKATYVILQWDANRFLYPAIQTWPTPSKTAETFLGRIEGDEVVIVNRTRHLENIDFNLRFPVSQPDLPLAMAARGIEGVVEGFDYRGKKVIAVTQILKGTPWIMVSKMDKEEAFAHIYRESIYLAGIFILIITTVIFFSFYFWQYLGKKHIKDLYVSQLALWSSEELHRVTLKNIGEAVITTDEKGIVKFMNPVAEQLTGWQNEETISRPLEDFYKIYDEKTGEIVKNPVQKVIDSGKITKLSNHTILISREKKEYPVAVNGAPIKDEGGAIQGVVIIFRDQTEERKTQKILKENEAKYRSLFENMMEGFALHEMIFDSTGNPKDFIFLEVNRAFEKLTGLKEKEIIRKNISEVLPGIKEETDDWIKRYGNIVLTGKESYFESYSEALNRWYAIHAFPGIDNTFATIFNDITERKLIEKNLIESEKRYKSLIKNIPGMAYRCYNKADWPMLYCSEGCKDITGYTANELTDNKGTNYGHLIHSDDKKYVWDSIQKAIYNDESFSIEYRIVKDNEEKWVWEKGKAIRYSGFEEILLEGIIMDITIPKKTKENLVERETKLRTLLNTIPDMVWIKNTEGVYVVCNPEVEKVFGAKEKDIIGKTDYDFVDKELADSFRANDLEVIQNKKPTVNEEEVTFINDRRKAILETIKTPVYDDKNNLVGVLGISRNITNRKQNENEIRRLSVAVEQSPLSIVITDPQGNIEYANPKFYEITGYSQEELLGRNPRILSSGHHTKEYYRNMWDTIKNGHIWRGEFKNKKKNNELYWESVTISPILSDKNEITHFMALKEDITKTKELESQLLQSQKLEAIGQLAGGVAHDFNNILTVINGFSSLLLTEMGSSNPYYEDIEQIAKAGERAGFLTNQLLAFSRKQIIKPVLLNLNELINDTLKILRRIIGEHIKIEIRLDNELNSITADFGQINQVILNLAVNARDAMPQGGTLIIETQKAFIDKEYSAKHLDLVEGEYVVLSVIDNGMGMDKKTQEKIFEPFFTTKGVGKGTGLGLSTVYGIVKQNNGNIWFYSEPQKGTTFKVYLPVAESSPDADKKNNYEGVIQGGNENILVIEDDMSVLELAVAILKSAGYNVTAKRGDSLNKSKLGAIRKKIDLLITDVIMPGMGSQKIVEYLKKTRPDLKVIFMSGYSDDTISKSGTLYEDISLLQKPFLPNELLKMVRKTLDKD